MLKKKPGQRLAYLPSAEVGPLAECLVALANGDARWTMMLMRHAAAGGDDAICAQPASARSL